MVCEGGEPRRVCVSGAVRRRMWESEQVGRGVWSGRMPAVGKGKGGKEDGAPYVGVGVHHGLQLRVAVDGVAQHVRVVQHRLHEGRVHHLLHHLAA